MDIFRALLKGFFKAKEKAGELLWQPSGKKKDRLPARRGHAEKQKAKSRARGKLARESRRKNRRKK